MTKCRVVGKQGSTHSTWLKIDPDLQFCSKNSPQITVPDHQSKLTKNGPKPIIEKDPPKKKYKPRMVPSVVDQELKKLDRGAARYDRAQAAKRKRDELGPA